MAIQVIVKTVSAKEIELALGDIATQCEIFPIDDGHFGLSIPTKVIDTFGEQLTESKISALEYFELWAGSWHKPKSKWRFW